MFLKAYHSGLNYLNFSSRCSEWLSLYCQNQISLRRPSGANKSAEIKELASLICQRLWYWGESHLTSLHQFPLLCNEDKTVEVPLLGTVWLAN